MSEAKVVVELVGTGEAATRTLRRLRLVVDENSPPEREQTQSAEIRRALYRVGILTPYGRQIDDWLAPDPPTWEFHL